MPNKKRANRSASRTIRINRAPVLTLWATIVAERMGFRRDEALTLGRAVAGLNAYTKGKSLGLYKPKPKDLAVRRRAMRHGEILHTELLHRAVSAVHTPDGLRALSKDRPIDPDSVQRYLESKFGAGLAAARAAMTRLARAHSASALASDAYSLYEAFRPAVPAGLRGWGAAGVLDLGKIAKLAQ